MDRPRVKTVFPPMPLDDRTIAIGGSDFGFAAEFEDDEERHMWQLLQLLDGTRTRAEVVEELRRSDPLISAEDVEAALTMLCDAGYLEDAAVPPPAELTSDELVRYQRNAEFFTFFTGYSDTGYAYQQMLKRARVTVLGIGGLGSYAALALAAAGVGELKLVDDDVVEPHNLNRQVLYTAADVGTSKVVAARKRIAQLNPHIDVSAVEARVASVADARACMADQDLVICAADRPRIRIYEWLNAAAIAERVPWVRGANDGLTINVFLHVPGETACFTCAQNRGLQRIPQYAARLQFYTEVLGDRTVNPCTAPVAGMIGSLVAMEAVKYLSGATRPVIRNTKLILDLRTLQTQFLGAERDEACSECGHLAAPTEQAPAS